MPERNSGGSVYVIGAGGAPRVTTRKRSCFQSYQESLEGVGLRPEASRRDEPCDDADGVRHCFLHCSSPRVASRLTNSFDRRCIPFLLSFAACQYATARNRKHRMRSSREKRRPSSIHPPRPISPMSWNFCRCCNRMTRLEVERVAPVDIEGVRFREAMLQQLESSIQSMHQELATLLREILMRQAVEEDS